MNVENAKAVYLEGTVDEIMQYIKDNQPTQVHIHLTSDDGIYAATAIVLDTRVEYFPDNWMDEDNEEEY